MHDRSPLVATPPDLADVRARATRAVRAAQASRSRSAVVPYVEREILDDGSLGAWREKYKRVPIAQTVDEFWTTKHAIDMTRRGAPRSTSRPASRSRSSHRAQSGHRRSAASSPTSSNDPGSDSDEPEPEPRLCACGCGQDISHKRVDARTFDANCRKRLSRKDGAVFPDDVREDRQIAWTSAVAGEISGHRWLTEQLDDELAEILAAERVARSRTTTPRRTEMDDLAITRWLMESNGTYTGPRQRGSAWKRPEHCLRTRTGAAA